MLTWSREQILLRHILSRSILGRQRFRDSLGGLYLAGHSHGTKIPILDHLVD